MPTGKKGKHLDRYVPDYVIFDLETTGVSPQQDEVVEIAALRVRGGKVEAEFSQLVNPRMPIPYGASKVNGITDDMVAGKPVFSEVLPEFLDFAGKDVLAGHNIHSFDMQFIYRDAERYLGRIPENDCVDTLVMARAALPNLRHRRLTDLAAYYGISTDGAHRALQDCRMNQQIFERLSKETFETRICPRCGSNLVRRKGKFGAFFGCSGYPGCRYTENV